MSLYMCETWGMSSRVDLASPVGLLLNSTQYTRQSCVFKVWLKGLERRELRTDGHGERKIVLCEIHIITLILLSRIFYLFTDMYV